MCQHSSQSRYQWAQALGFSLPLHEEPAVHPFGKLKNICFTY
jgi:hypothetical protein